MMPEKSVPLLPTIRWRWASSRHERCRLPESERCSSCQQFRRDRGDRHIRGIRNLSSVTSRTRVAGAGDRQVARQATMPADLLTAVGPD